jgi:hypothetical protein
MEIQLRGVYRKSEQGIAEVKVRSTELTVRERSALILVNGVETVTVLRDKIGPQAIEILQNLFTQGYIEPVAVAARTLRAVQASPAPLRDEATRLKQLCRLAVDRFTPLFGPDVANVVRPLFDARNFATYNTALDSIEPKLGIYLGRKQAAVLVATLRP